MTKLLMTCGLLVALAACASNQPASSSASSSSAAASTVAAAPGATSAVAATTAAKPQPAKLVCEETDQMGSHFQQRVCMTPEQMEARRKAAQAAMLGTHSTASCGQNGCSGTPPPR